VQVLNSGEEDVTWHSFKGRVEISVDPLSGYE